jgi:hypothetical protein
LGQNELIKGGVSSKEVRVADELALEDEVRRLRAELERERELRFAAEALAADRQNALEESAPAPARKSRRRFRSSSRRDLQGNWLR